MICTKCNNEGVLNTALGKEFYYCRTCREEITATPVDEMPFASDEELEDLLKAVDDLTVNPDDGKAIDWFDIFNAGCDLKSDMVHAYPVSRNFLKAFKDLLDEKLLHTNPPEEML